jgi:hypothetical protein
VIFEYINSLLVASKINKTNNKDAVNTRKEAINTSVLQMVAARSTTGGDGIDDNATAFSV